VDWLTQLIAANSWTVGKVESAALLGDSAAGPVRHAGCDPEGFRSESAAGCGHGQPGELRLAVSAGPLHFQHSRRTSCACCSIGQQGTWIACRSRTQWQAAGDGAESFVHECRSQDNRDNPITQVNLIGCFHHDHQAAPPGCQHRQAAHLCCLLLQLLSVVSMVAFATFAITPSGQSSSSPAAEMHASHGTHGTGETRAWGNVCGIAVWYASACLLGWSQWELHGQIVAAGPVNTSNRCECEIGRSD
jgi:hypothetical protein